MASSRRRSHPRVSANISVKVRTPHGKTTTTEKITNVSLGGVFIEMDDPMPFGTEVALEFSLPVAPRTLRCQGFVVWSTKSPEVQGPAGRDGIGVRLMDIGIADMRILAEFIENKLSP